MISSCCLVDLKLNAKSGAGCTLDIVIAFLSASEPWSWTVTLCSLVFASLMRDRDFDPGRTLMIAMMVVAVVDWCMGVEE